jgi:hypothetical protein
MASYAAHGLMLGAEPALRLHAVAVGASATQAPLTIEVYRWSTDAERSPLLAALSAPQAVAPSPAADPPRAGRGGGRGGRGGRGAAAPPSPAARLASAISAAPTIGYIWGHGVTGYSVKYAWQAPSAGGAPGRIVLVVERRLGVHAPDWAPAPGAPQDAEFTLIDVRIDATGRGEGRTSLTTRVVVDTAHQTLALDDYASAPVFLRVTP